MVDALWQRAVECLTGPDRWSYLAIPFVGAFIGWFTNWKAIKLTFYPRRFIGLPPYLGWQGIVPRKAEKMAGMAIDIILTKLLRLEDLFAKLDPKEMATQMHDPLTNILPQLIAETVSEYAPAVWDNLPEEARALAIAKMQQDAPQVVADILEEIRANPAEVLDLRTMVVDACKRDVDLLNRVFLTVGKKEFQFIEFSGLIFGIPFGILQMLVWFYVQPWWFLTVGGAVVGGFINWLAIVMIFNPKQPRRFGPFMLHGLFMRRQKEVAAAYSKMVAEELLNTQNIVDAILKGPLSDGLFRIISKHVKACAGPADRADDAVHRVHDRHPALCRDEKPCRRPADGGSTDSGHTAAQLQPQSAGYRKHPAHQAGTDAGQGFRGHAAPGVQGRRMDSDRTRRGAGRPGRLSAVAPGFLIAALPERLPGLQRANCRADCTLFAGSRR